MFKAPNVQSIEVRRKPRLLQSALVGAAAGGVILGIIGSTDPDAPGLASVIIRKLVN